MKSHKTFISVFIIMCVIAAIDAEINSSAGARLRSLFSSSRIIPNTNTVAQATNEVATSTNAISFSRISVTTNSFIAEYVLDPSVIPLGSFIELYDKEQLTNTWQYFDSQQTELGITNGTFTVATTTNSASLFLSMNVDALSFSFSDCASTTLADGHKLFITDTKSSISVSISRSERSPAYPASDPSFADNPFANISGAFYDSTNETLTVDNYGSCELPTGDILLVIDPQLTYGSPHDYSGDSIYYDQDSETYVRESTYPPRYRLSLGELA